MKYCLWTIVYRKIRIFIECSKLIFSYKIRPLFFFRLDSLTPVIFGDLYTLLFGVSYASVLKAVHWHKMIYLYTLILRWWVGTHGTFSNNLSNPRCSFINIIKMFLKYFNNVISILFGYYECITTEPWGAFQKQTYEHSVFCMAFKEFSK